MIDIIEKIMNDAAPLWGVCGYEQFAEKMLGCRAASRIPAGAKSIITAAFPYLLDEKSYGGLNVSRYAAVADYHTVISERLGEAAKKLEAAFPGESFAPFADNSPVPEVEAAIKSGLGVRGDNSLLITKEFGSFVFIGEIVTTLYIAPSEPIGGECLRCGRCRKSCPAGAIGENGIDASKCLSAVTQKKGELSPDEQELIKSSGCAWGCDICQLCCPLNSGAGATSLGEFINSCVPRVLPDMPIEGRAFAWRGEKVIRRNLAILNEK